MITYIITIPGLEVSEKQAQECILSAQEFGIHAQLFPATNKFEAPKLFKQYGLLGKLPKGIQERHHPFKHEWLGAGEAGCFMSHYRLWHLCVTQGEPILVLEDDAVFKAALPKSISIDDYLCIGEFTQLWNAPDRFAHMFDNRVKYDCNFDGIQDYPLKNALGTHAYIISPTGAKKMIHATNTAKRLWPVDVMMKKKYIDMKILTPCPVVASTNVSAVRDVNLWDGFK